MAKRPVHLNLLKIKFPITAIISILHRLSGIFLFTMLPILLWGLSKSLESPEGFDAVRAFFCYPISKLSIIILFTSLFYHTIAGIRHMVMDVGVGESLKAARFSARLMLMLTLLFTLGFGVWLW